MTIFEYTKDNDVYLLTDYIDDGSDEVCLKFFPEGSGETILLSESFKVECGSAVIKRINFKDGEITPILKTENEAFRCEKIKCQSGSVTPAAPTRERIFELTKKVISAQNRIITLEKRVAELSEAVYGKTIF